MYNQLSKADQDAIMVYLQRNGIEPTKENLDQHAKRYDDIIYKEVIASSTYGLVAGISSKQFVQFTRNEIVENMLGNALSMAGKYGQNLMIVSYNTSASPLCINRQNKVYWTIEKEDNYEELAPQLWANGGGLFHPNCRHQIYAYFKDESDPPEKELPKSDIEDNYNLTQQKNYVNRNKKQWYARKEKARLTDSPHQAYETAKWKEWVARSKQFN